MIYNQPKQSSVRDNAKIISEGTVLNILSRTFMWHRKAESIMIDNPSAEAMVS